MSPHFSVLAPQFLMKCQGPHCSPRGSACLASLFSPPRGHSQPHSLPYSHTGLSILSTCQPPSPPGPLLWLFLLPGMLFPQMSTYLTPAFPLGLSSNVTSMSFSLVSVCNFLSGPFPSLSPALCFPMRLIPTEPARKCFEGRELVCLGHGLSSTPNAL